MESNGFRLRQHRSSLQVLPQPTRSSNNLGNVVHRSASASENGSVRMTNIANAKKKMLPGVRKTVVNANGSKSENCSKHASVTDKLNTNGTNIDLELDQGPFRHTKQEVNFRDKGLFRLTKVEGLFLDQFLLTMEAGSSQASVRCLHTMGEDSFQDSVRYLHTTEEDNFQDSVRCLHTTGEDNFRANALYPRTTEGVNSQASFQVNVLCPLTMEEDSSPDRSLSPHTSPVVHFLANALFRLTAVAELYRAPSLFLPTTLEGTCRVVPNLSPLISGVGASRDPLPPHTTPTPTTDPPTVRLRRELAI